MDDKLYRHKKSPRKIQGGFNNYAAFFEKR